MIKAVKTSGIKFVMHVIGFDVTDKEKAQLSCLAEVEGRILRQKTPES
jgi:Ca-activated chloride channel homolog